MNEPPVSRDNAAYPWGHRPDGHNAQGLFAEGPQGEHCAIATLVYFTFCRITAASPDGERKRRVTYKGREARARQIRIGGYLVSSAKRPNSGRKRRVAA